MGDYFCAHVDGSWPGSGINETGLLVLDKYGDRWSQLTFLLYLNDDFEGGQTRFFFPGDHNRKFHVRPTIGTALCFFHGEHPLSPLHEGCVVSSGTKYVLRTDVLYMVSSRI